MAQKKTPSEKGKEAVEDRQGKYGHPADVYQRVAYIWTAILAHKLKDGEIIEPHEVGLCQAGLKLGREAETPNVEPDNLTDMSGYADAVSMVYERRPPSTPTT
jgi:Domain of unknown function (DUF6378)